MQTTLREPLGGERAKVLDVVRYYGATITGRRLKDEPVAATYQVVAINDRQHITTSFPQQDRDLR